MVRVPVVRSSDRRPVRGSGVRSAPRGTRVRTAGWTRRRLVVSAWRRP
jgi:hypothetical protein